MVAGHLRIQNGIYQMVIETTDLYGKRKSISRSTGLKAKGNKKRAEEMLLLYRQSYSKEQIVTLSSNMDFSEYMGEWLRLVKDNLAVTTYAAYDSNIHQRIIPYFQTHKVMLMDLKPHHIQKFYAYAKSTYAIKNKTLLRYHANIRKALDYAVKKELILSNPADYVERPKQEAFHAQYYNQEELEQLFEAFRGDPLELVVTLTAYFGLRREEVLGLRWSAIDFKKNDITIQHTVVQYSLDGQRMIHTQDRTKTKSSYRTLPLTQNIRATLFALYERRKQDKKQMPSLYEKSGEYICLDAGGNLFRPDYVTQHFQIVLKKNGLRRIRFHDLRHSCASYLYANKVPMKNIQEWLGHSEIGTTMNLYTHTDYQEKLNTANVLNNLK